MTLAVTLAPAWGTPLSCTRTNIGLLEPAVTLSGALIATVGTAALAITGMSHMIMSIENAPMIRLPVTTDILISCPPNKICITAYK
jgi:hypothetical protein